jgi:hypothetical protein
MLKVVYHDLGAIRAELHYLDECSCSLQKHIAEFRYEFRCLHHLDEL